MSNLCIGTATPTKLRVLPNTKSDLCTASSQLPRSSESCQAPSQTCAQHHRNSHEAQSLAKHQVKPVHSIIATPTKLRVLPSTKSNLCTASSQLPRSSESCQAPSQTCAQR